jgi:hypothetical protein
LNKWESLNTKICSKELPDKKFKPKPIKSTLTVIKRRMMLEIKRKQELGMIGRMITRKELEIATDADLIVT